MVIAEEMRYALYLPLGLLSTLAFTLRFLIQWLQSEKAGYSLVTPLFWWLSLLGNTLLALHSLIQGQFLICVVQHINGAISLRNLNLLQSYKKWSLQKTCTLFLVAICAPFFLFYFFSGDAWFRIPAHAWHTPSLNINFLWQAVGALGVLLFAARFWVQWILAELTGETAIPACFWWLSLSGALLSIFYFAAIGDYVNLAGPLCGLFPYFRNLKLIKNRIL